MNQTTRVAFTFNLWLSQWHGGLFIWPPRNLGNTLGLFCEARWCGIGRRWIAVARGCPRGYKMLSATGWPIQSWNVYPFASSLLVGRQSLNQRLRSSASPITGTAPFLVLVRLPPKIMAKTLVTLLMLVFVLNLCRTMSLSKVSGVPLCCWWCTLSSPLSIRRNRPTSKTTTASTSIPTVGTVYPAVGRSTTRWPAPPSTTSPTCSYRFSWFH